MTTIGIIGLGAMGGAIASALVRGGHVPIGYDLDAGALASFAAEGGRAAANAAEVAAATDLVVLVLRHEHQIDALLDARKSVTGALRPGSVVWLASTVPPDYVSGLGERLALAGIHLLDGPVSGGVGRARAGRLTLILAGDDVAIDAAVAFAPALAERVFRVGNAPGAASVIKAVNQLLTASHIALTAEALGLAIRAGVDPRMFQDVVNASAGASRMFQDRAPRMLDGDFAPHATIDVFLKDLAIALDTARRYGAQTPVATAAHEVFRQAAEAFGSDLGDPAIFRLYQPKDGGQF